MGEKNFLISCWYFSNDLRDDNSNRQLVPNTVVFLTWDREDGFLIIMSSSLDRICSIRIDILIMKHSINLLKQIYLTIMAQLSLAVRFLFCCCVCGLLFWMDLVVRNKCESLVIVT